MKPRVAFMIVLSFASSGAAQGLTIAEATAPEIPGVVKGGSRVQMIADNLQGTEGPIGAPDGAAQGFKSLRDRTNALLSHALSTLTVPALAVAIGAALCSKAAVPSAAVVSSVPGVRSDETATVRARRATQ